MPVLREHEVEVELVGQALVQPDALAVEGRAFGRAVVRADDRRVPAGRARADVRLLEDGDVADAVPLREVVRGREPVRAAADDDDLVAALQLGPRAPHPLREENLADPRVLLEPGERVEHRLGDVVAELLLDVDPEPVVRVAKDERGHARERPGGGKLLEVEVGQASQHRLVADRDPGERAGRVVGEGTGGANALGDVGGVVVGEEEAAPRREPNELLARAGLD